MALLDFGAKFDFLTEFKTNCCTWISVDDHFRFEHYKDARTALDICEKPKLADELWNLAKQFLFFNAFDRWPTEEFSVEIHDAATEYTKNVSRVSMQ